MNLTVDVRGLKEIDALLKQLGPRVQRRVVRTAVTAGARVLAKEAKARVPVDSGALKKAITVRNRKARPGTEKAAIGFNKVQDRRRDTAGRAEGATKLTSPSRRAHLVEFGTGDRTQKNGKSVGSAPAQPFLRPALAAGSGAAIQAFTEKAAANLAKEAERFATGQLDAKGRIRR